MNKAKSHEGRLPYGEIFLKAADSRPIVIRLQSLGGHVEISAGDAHDMVELEVFCRLVSSVARSIGVTRQIKEEHERGALKFSEDGDILI